MVENLTETEALHIISPAVSSGQLSIPGVGTLTPKRILKRGIHTDTVAALLDQLRSEVPGQTAQWTLFPIEADANDLLCTMGTNKCLGKAVPHE